MLGLSIDDRLSFSSHVHQIIKRLNSQVFIIRNLSKILELKTVLLTYYANFQGIIQYGIAVWGNSTLTEEILLIQKRALRIMTRKPSNYHTKELFVKWKVLTVFNLYIYEVLRISIKTNFITLEGMKPQHYYSTRHSFHNLNTSMPKNSIESMAVHLFNSLSKTLKKIFQNEGPNLFLMKLKQELLNKPYYSMNEFLLDPVWNKINQHAFYSFLYFLYFKFFITLLFFITTFK